MINVLDGAQLGAIVESREDSLVPKYLKKESACKQYAI